MIEKSIILFVDWVNLEDDIIPWPKFTQLNTKFNICFTGGLCPVPRYIDFVEETHILGTPKADYYEGFRGPEPPH